jgi:hypothetical protein
MGLVALFVRPHLRLPPCLDAIAVGNGTSSGIGRKRNQLSRLKL